MANIITMQGTEFLNATMLLERLAKRTDIAHVTIVLHRNDGMSEVCYDRQEIHQIIMAAAQLNYIGIELTSGTVDNKDWEK